MDINLSEEIALKMLEILIIHSFHLEVLKIYFLIYKVIAL